MENLWHELSLLEKRLENQRVSIQVVKSRLNENEKVHYSGQEQEDIIEANDAEKRSIEDLISCLQNEEEERLAGSLMISLKSSDQRMDMMISKGDRPNVFISDILCVVADLVNEEQLLQTIIHAKEDEKPNKCLMCNDKLERMLVKGYHVSHD